MQLERFNAIVFAVVVFCVVGTIFVAVSLIATVFVGLHFNILSLFGSSHSGTDKLLGLFLFVLFLLSLAGAYLLASKTYRAVLQHEIAQEIAPLAIDDDHSIKITQTYDGPTKGP